MLFSQSKPGHGMQHPLRTPSGCRSCRACKRSTATRVSAQPEKQGWWPVWPPGPAGDVPLPEAGPSSRPDTPRQPSQMSPGEGSNPQAWPPPGRSLRPPPPPPPAQPGQDQQQTRREVAKQMLMDSGNKWKWPAANTPAAPSGSPTQDPGSSLPGSSRMARRMYENKALQDLVRQDQQQRQQQSPGRTAGLPGAPQQQQPATRPQPSANDVMPEPPGFFSSREEAQQFMDWMTAKRAKRAQQMEASYDNEISGIARVYLVAAAVIIMLGLWTAYQ